MKKDQSRLFISQISEKYAGIYHILKDANEDNYLKKFKSYCTEILKLYQSKKINDVQFGYLICNAIKYPIFNDEHEIEEIINIGCMLELPKKHREFNNHKYLKELIIKINEIIKMDG